VAALDGPGGDFDEASWGKVAQISHEQGKTDFVGDIAQKSGGLLEIDPRSRTQRLGRRPADR
jgi:hypothetical protein